MPSRDHYIVGKCGSYIVPTVALVDAAIRGLTARLATPDHVLRLRLWNDIDLLLSRRYAMTAVKAEAL